eukprot:TRINITY_DN28221_c0_g1_i5.p1 TRINITY_DN28221_c0_g1~~TRINITY_DN28221_c0_g1_i5.p1  ORF type:complete len:602 (-),score=159.70 TRINITY_DN28221_c0_g1_i5:157-1962(-)
MVSTAPAGSRILDAFLEDGEDRSPIDGLFPEDLPVRGLDECIAQVQHAFAVPIDSAVRKAKRRAIDLQPRYPQLSSDSLAILVLYTMEASPREESFYYKLNGALREMQRKQVKTWRDTIWLLLNSMRDGPRATARVLFRGTQKARNELGKQCEKGKEFVWSAFSSTTTHIESTHEFLGKDGPRVLWTLEMQPVYLGVELHAFSFFEHECEVLLPPETVFRVTSVLDMGHDLILVQCQQIDEPPLIAISPRKVPGAAAAALEARSHDGGDAGPGKEVPPQPLMPPPLPGSLDASLTQRVQEERRGRASSSSPSGSSRSRSRSRQARQEACLSDEAAGGQQPGQNQKPDDSSASVPPTAPAAMHDLGHLGPAELKDVAAGAGRAARPEDETGMAGEGDGAATAAAAGVGPAGVPAVGAQPLETPPPPAEVQESMQHMPEAEAATATATAGSHAEVAAEVAAESTGTEAAARDILPQVADGELPKKAEAEAAADERRADGVAVGASQAPEADIVKKSEGSAASAATAAAVGDAPPEEKATGASSHTQQQEEAAAGLAATATEEKKSKKKKKKSGDDDDEAPERKKGKVAGSKGEASGSGKKRAR